MRLTSNSNPSSRFSLASPRSRPGDHARRHRLVADRIDQDESCRSRGCAGRHRRTAACSVSTTTAPISFSRSSRRGLFSSVLISMRCRIARHRRRAPAASCASSGTAASAPAASRSSRPPWLRSAARHAAGCRGCTSMSPRLISISSSRQTVTDIGAKASASSPS